MIYRFLALLSLIFFASPEMSAYNEKAAPDKNKDSIRLALNDSIFNLPARPKIGLVLSGGGAKGSAHIGVLKVIDELGIPIDYITGTSMGSIIGGLYALGYSADEMEELISNLDWPLYMSDKTPRKYLSLQEKERRSKFILDIPFTFGKNDSLSILQSLPGGVVTGNNLENLFNSLAMGYQGDIDFNNLPIPYACVATDMVTGKEVVFHKGNLPKAIRASMSIPAVFAPVRMNNMVLVDGGLKNNIPVDVCKEMGADIIIGVMVGSQVQGDTLKLHSIVGVLGELFGVMITNQTSSNVSQCDVFIEPDISSYGVLSFDKKSISNLISNGYAAANAQRETLEELKNLLSRWDEEKPKPHVPKAKNLSNDTITIDKINISGVTDNEAKWLLSKSGLKKKKNLTGKELDEQLHVIYGTNAFTKVNYSVEEDTATGKYNLSVCFKKKQSNSFNFALRFDNQEAASLHLRLGLNTHKITSPQLELTAKLGYNPAVTVKAAYSHQYWPKINLSYKIRKTESVINDFGNAYGNSVLVKQQVKLFLSETYSRDIGFEVGARFDQHLYSRLMTARNFTPLVSDRSGNPYIGVFGTYIIDTRDLPYFTTKGIRMDLSASWMLHDFYRPDDFSRFGDVMLMLKSYIPIANGLVFSPQCYSRVLLGNGYQLEAENSYNATYNNYMGGLLPGRYVDQQLPFAGINKPEEMYNNLVIFMGELRYNVYRRHYVSLLGSFARESKTFANMFEPVKALAPEEVVGDDKYTSYNWWGATLQYSFKSPTGPLIFDIAYSNITRSINLYISLGFDF